MAWVNYFDIPGGLKSQFGTYGTMYSNPQQLLAGSINQDEIDQNSDSEFKGVWSSRPQSSFGDYGIPGAFEFDSVIQKSNATADVQIEAMALVESQPITVGTKYRVRYMNTGGAPSIGGIFIGLGVSRDGGSFGYETVLYDAVISNDIPDSEFHDWQEITVTQGILDAIPGFGSNARLSGLVVAMISDQSGNYYNQSGYVQIQKDVGTAPIVDDDLNCNCESNYARTTMLEMFKQVARRTGYASQVNNPPPGVKELIYDYIQQAQLLCMIDFDELGHERFFKWDLAVGQRRVDFDENDETCRHNIQALAIKGAYIRNNGATGEWTRLGQGINPLLYSGGIHSTGPTRYELRECIELWPRARANQQLIILGNFKSYADVADTDYTTADPQAVFLRATALYMLDKGHPSAQTYQQMYNTYVGNIVAGTHSDRRYIPGCEWPLPYGWDRLTKNMDALTYGATP